MGNKQKKFYGDHQVIAIHLPPNENIRRIIGNIIKAKGYKILDLNLTRNALPSNLKIAGLLTDKLPNDILIQKLLKDGVKVVRYGKFPYPEGDSKVPAVLPDFYAAVKLAAEHFAERQFRDVAFVGQKPWKHFQFVFEKFYERALEQGCRCHLLQMETPTHLNANYMDKIFKSRMQQIREWLERIPKPVGVFTYNDANAALIYTTANLANIEIPEQVALLGMGNNPAICDFLPVSLSSVDVSIEERLRTSFDILIRLIDGESIPESPVFIPPKGVITRQSTNLLAVPDPVVARAMRFIWDNFTKQISIDDVARVTGVSRRSLTGKFQQTLGYSVNYELRRKRLEKSCQLLRVADMTIADIAASSGFPSPTYFHIAFRNAFGMTPGNFRKQQK